MCVAVALLASTRCWRTLGAFLLGVLLFAVNALYVVDQRIEHQFEGDSMLCVVRILDFPKITDSMVSMLIAPVDDARLPARVRLSWYEPHALPGLGDVWQFEVRLRRPRGGRNPGVFDYETWLFRERVGATGYVVPGKRNRLLAAGMAPFTDRLRQRLVARIGNVVDDDATAAVLIAIVTGARHLISRDQWQRFAATGTSHLMAISGLHVGLAAVTAYTVASFAGAIFGARGNTHEVALVLSLLVAGGYVLVSGFAVPAQRALLMLALATLTALRRRQLFAGPVVSAVCIAVVLLDPLTTMQPGFKLSFAAVVALLWLAKFRRSGPAVMRLVAMQLVLMMGLLTLTAPVFDRVALFAPPINLIAVPLFSFVTLPAALAGAFLNLDAGLVLAAKSLAWIESLIALIVRLPGADLSVADVHGAAWLFVAMPTAWAVLPPGWPGRHAAWLGLLALVCWRPDAPAYGCLRAAVLDVGQGLAVALQTRHHTVLYDTGPSFRGGGSAAERVVHPYLTSRGISHIDALLVSHGDLDHAGGLDYLRRHMSPGLLLLGEPPANTSLEHRRCRKGLRWKWDGIEFRILHPPADSDFAGNDASCVLLVAAGRHRLLVTGDIESVAEQLLVQDGDLPTVDVLTVPHHGSRTSSSPPFVDRLAPRWAIVSAAHRNRWGLPQSAVVARWEERGAAVLGTSGSGAITFHLCQRGGVGSLRQTRLRDRRMWHEL